MYIQPNNNKMIITLILGFIVILIIVILLYIKKINCLEEELEKANSLCKSQQVKFGKSFEHFVPFINDFPANRENTVFLGMPIDFISFEEDSIKFIEVKTGVSQLSNKQKHTNQLILDKKIEWYELRYEHELQ